MEDNKNKRAYVITWQVMLKALAVMILVRLLMIYFPIANLSDLVQAMISGAVGALAMFSFARTKGEGS
ncbi:MAG: hypothetical protein V3V04_00660 [Rhizobiaceae bacterium]